MQKKTFIFFTVLLLLQISVKAQKGSFSLGLGPSSALAIIDSKNFKAQFKPGFGAGISALYNTSDKSSLVLRVNYLSMAPKSANLLTLKWTAIKLGYRTYFNNSNVFVFGEGGLNIFSSKNSSSNTSFGLGAGLGYSISVGKSSSIDIAPSYDLLLSNPINSNWLGLNIAYRIKFK